MQTYSMLKVVAASTRLKSHRWKFHEVIHTQGCKINKLFKNNCNKYIQIIYFSAFSITLIFIVSNFTSASTSNSAERIFSTARYVHNDYRNKPAPLYLESDVFEIYFELPGRKYSEGNFAKVNSFPQAL